MAAFPYMPLFVADYLADTRHLTPAQHGAYLLLIMNYWQRAQPLPDDDAKLARIVGMSRRDWAHNRDAVLDFFTMQENLLVHPRIAHELSRVEAKSLKSKKAAQASVERRFSGRSADVEPTDTDKNREDKKERKEGGGKPPTSFAFFGQTVRLTPQHLDRWRKTYHRIHDLEAELTTIDAWWQGQAEDERKQWFHRTAGMLNRKHQETLGGERQAEGGSSWNGLA